MPSEGISLNIALTQRVVSLFRRLKEVRVIVNNPVNKAVNKAKMLRIDWSENVTLFQTRSEKGDYYHDITACVNTAVLYENEGK